MKFVFGKQDMTCLERAQEHCFLLTNGLGGFMSASAAFSVTRCDQAVLMAAVVYEMDNRTAAPCTLRVRPFCLFAPKGEAAGKIPAWSNCALRAGGYILPVYTNGAMTATETVWETLSYPDDAKDGRIAEGKAAACCVVSRTIQPGGTRDAGDRVFLGRYP